MFFIASFVISWVVWLIFADKQRWKELFPVAIFAGYLAGLSDDLMRNVELWSYKYNPEKNALIEFLTDIGIYIVTTYLFIQWFPKKRVWLVFRYLFIWTGFTITMEWIYFVTGHIQYHKWWNIGWSYFSDWLLFLLFYLFHKNFKLERLNDNQR
ncbi:CBO0543 family protein [Ammoniphilus sp. 3BR4]|uniref:CBO0543 family protein n=1 Tax=Ammoniphilus sp. 3BR4 TaxID=3158265 RepID=UPI0034650EB7